MKSTITNSIIIIVLASFSIAGGIDQIKSALGASRAEFMARNKNMRDPEALEKIYANLSSENTDVVLAAVDKLKELKDNQLLLIMLKHPVSSVKIRASQALHETGDGTAVPELTSALVKSNRDPVIGGTEAVLWNRQTKSALIVTIAKLSGVKYEGTADLRFPEVGEYIDKLNRAGFGTKKEADPPK